MHRGVLVLTAPPGGDLPSLRLLWIILRLFGTIHPPINNLSLSCVIHPSDYPSIHALTENPGKLFTFY